MKKFALFSICTVLSLMGCNEETSQQNQENTTPSANVKTSAQAPAADTTSVTDRDGNVYKTIRIGKQLWMQENLRTQTPNSWCYEPVNAEKCQSYGRLYTWDAAINACPTGWTLPDNSDWEELKAFAESKAGVGKSGKALKAIMPYYTPDAMQATDDFGFAAMLAGNKVLEKFKLRDETGYYWSATDDDASHAYDWIFTVTSDELTVGNVKYSLKKNGMSVRCIHKEKSIEEEAVITDERDGKTYKVAKIGSQRWMAENLAYKTSSSKCFRDNCNKFGRLYTWTDAMQLPKKYINSTFSTQGNVKGICPDGWHIPSYDEWKALLKNVEKKTSEEKAWVHLLSKDEVMLDYYICYSMGLFWDDEELGKGPCYNLNARACAEKVFKVKGDGDKNIQKNTTVGTDHYKRFHGVNSFGFNAHIVGFVNDGDAEDIGERSYTAYWTSTDKDLGQDEYSHEITVVFGSDGSDQRGHDGSSVELSELKKFYLPVRCIKD